MWKASCNTSVRGQCGKAKQHPHVTFAARSLCITPNKKTHQKKWKMCLILLMEEILHLLISSLSHYLQGLCIPGGAGFLPSTVPLVTLTPTLKITVDLMRQKACDLVTCGHLTTSWAQKHATSTQILGWKKSPRDSATTSLLWTIKLVATIWLVSLPPKDMLFIFIIFFFIPAMPAMPSQGTQRAVAVTKPKPPKPPVTNWVASKSSSKLTSN